jgi:hypothetical protein
MGLDGILHRPLTEDDLLATVAHLLEPDAAVSGSPRSERPPLRPAAKLPDERSTAIKTRCGGDALNGTGSAE